MAKHLLLVLVVVATVCVSCEEKVRDPNKETLTHGKATLWCDAEIFPMLQVEVERYKSLHADCQLDVQAATAREDMEQLLSGKARLAIIARGYRHDEDSLMRSFHVKPHRTFHIATDALVFYTQKSFPVDTLSVEALKHLMSTGTSMRPLIRDLSFDPDFALPDQRSSVVANLEEYCANGSSLAKNVPARYYSDLSSVKQAVMSQPRTIGVGYLSQLINDTAQFKLLGIKYTDADSNRRSMKVEQSAVYREMYPYPVKILVYLLEDLQNFPMGVASYFAFEAEPQSYFLKKGIVPAYAKIQLYEE